MAASSLAHCQHWHPTPSTKSTGLCHLSGHDTARPNRASCTVASSSPQMVKWVNKMLRVCLWEQIMKRVLIGWQHTVLSLVNCFWSDWQKETDSLWPMTTHVSINARIINTWGSHIGLASGLHISCFFIIYFTPIQCSVLSSCENWYHFLDLSHAWKGSVMKCSQSEEQTSGWERCL